MSALFRFPKKELHLSPTEEKVVQKLSEAAAVISSLYLKQKNPRYAGANLYAHDVTREEIKAAAKKDPAVLSPYTFVEKDRNGNLAAVPYRKKFKQELERAAALLREAAARSEDRAFRAYLSARAEDLLQDNFDKSSILWLQAADAKIGCVIGPFDRFLDKLFYQKRAYTAWVGVLNEERREEASRLRELILTSAPTFLPGAKKATVPTIRVRVEDTILLAGLDADYMFISNNFPSSADLGLITKYGTMSTVFLPMAAWRTNRWMWPIFQALFDEKTREGCDASQLQEGLVRVSIIDEMRRSLVRYDDAPGRLEEYFAYIDEAYGDMLTIKAASYLYLKHVITEKELEVVVFAEVCQALYSVVSLGQRKPFEHLLYGYAAFLNSLLQEGGLEKSGRRFRLNLQRALLSTDHLVRTLEYYLALGTREEAQEFFDRFEADEVFENFRPFLRPLASRKG